MIANALWHRRAKASVAYKELTGTRAGAGREMMWRTGRGASAVSRRQRSRQRSNKWTVERAGVRAAGGEGCGIGERPLTYKAHLTWRWCSTRLPPLRIHCLETITNGHNRKGRCRCRYSLIRDTCARNCLHNIFNNVTRHCTYRKLWCRYFEIKILQDWMFLFW